jgi:hypothetical protein
MRERDVKKQKAGKNEKWNKYLAPFKLDAGFFNPECLNYVGEEKTYQG